MNISPLADRILVKRIDAEQVTKGGLIIPDTASEKPMEGEVVAVGSGRINDKGQVIKMDIKKGQRILFSKYSGNEISFDGDQHLFLREDEILAIIES